MLVKMLITLCYVYMWVRFHKCYSVLIRNSLSRLKGSSFSFSFCSNSPSAPARATPAEVQADARRYLGSLPPEDIVFLQLGDKAVYLTDPQACDDLSKWTVLLGSSLVRGPQIENISFVIEATGYRVGCHSHQTSNKKVLKWSDYCLPLACSPGQPFRVVAQTTVDNFSRLGVAFLEGCLQLDDGLLPSKIAKRRTEERRGSEPLHCTQDIRLVGDSEDNSMGDNHHMESHGHHLHLSSCHECLQLENSTIISVKYASAENIPDLPDDNSVELDSRAKSLDEHHQDTGGFFGQSGGFDCNNKPPNVLVYTDGCQERFQTVFQVLSECIDMENHVIYHLQPQQALSHPWMENTRLLVVAEEEALTPQLQTRFLTYLSQGGRVLGLTSTLCPAGLCLEVRERQRMVSRLNFIKEDSTELELSVLASGNFYVRDTRGGGEVELWGELKGEVAHQRDMVIVRITHEQDGGQAVLCQVHLEVAPENLTTESFDELKVSNAQRYEVLREILISLGLSCELNHDLTPTPIHLLAISLEAKAYFLKWLETQADQNGSLTLSKHSLRMVSCSELQDGSYLHEGSLDLVTDSSESQTWAEFRMETYRENLQTSLLGHTLFYTEMASSTMDLLEGLSLHLPKDVGLIAVAGRQSQGRGRGKNTWLSPLGCAMFTLKIQVELSSRLGQRIPFLQHLAALAVVEAVCTLPGYQDIDLRVKWPNDIYYSNLMKLGGVLVTSTVIGSTFHLLIGCGFNVTNSNPTVCINDLIQQYNTQHNCSLQPLGSAQLIARTVSCLEVLINSFQHGGPDAILPTYYKRWLHSGTKVQLWSEDGIEAEVFGLDHNGFLQVHSEEHGVISVEPDGNSFDMLKNLVVIKQR
ncbi:biotin--protein ligase isoform X3 [Limanda limanda]|uniref:biotin--protein ligase isoform X3 n=1 Tax=Limanda limanda TaxID=27771 RepID=UPI0029C888F0|nr:biotin--protein ligase isoform X3 [Limanda limanda]